MSVVHIYQLITNVSTISQSSLEPITPVVKPSFSICISVSFCFFLLDLLELSINFLQLLRRFYPFLIHSKMNATLASLVHTNVYTYICDITF